MKKEVNILNTIVSQQFGSIFTISPWTGDKAVFYTF